MSTGSSHPGVPPAAALAAAERWTGGRAVVEALLEAGVDHAFCVPGESFLGVLDALVDARSRLRLIATRHEGGASFMAEAYAKLSGRPAVCLGTRMVGAGNLAIGIHTAHQDSTPLVALIGQVGTDVRHREAFQEAELAQLFAPIAKWAVEPPSADRLGELVARAAYVARADRPGPVVVALREDLLRAPVAAQPPPHLPLPAPPAPDPELVRQTLALLRAAERPLLLLGAGVLAAAATAAWVRLAEAEQVPAVAAWRRPDVFPNDHPLYLGQTGLGAPPAVQARLLETDVALAVGARLDEMTTSGYRLPGPGTRLVAVDRSSEPVPGAELAGVADARILAEALLAAAEADPLPADRRAERQRRAALDRAAWEAQTTPGRGRARPGYVDQQAVIAHLRAALPPDAILTTDAGNFSGWLARYYRWRQTGTFVGPTSGAMGYGLPAAIGARLARPDRLAVACVGDGGFLMTGAELETAVREDVPVVVLVHDNGQYGTIRMHQQREHPGRPIATTLGPVDFAAFARSLGALGLTVRDDRDLGPALAEAVSARRPAVLHLRVDPDQLSVAADS